MNHIILKKYYKFHYIFLASCFFTFNLLADTWYVATDGVDNAATHGSSWESPFASISYAISQASASGDTILVSGGVYKLTTTINVSKSVILRGVDGYENTVIDGNYPAYSQRAIMADQAGTVISGFTVTNCNFDPQATPNGAVYISGNVQLTDCLISGCVASNYGGGLAIELGAVASNCIIRGNSVLKGYGGGVSIAKGTITHSIISDNTASESGGGLTKRADSTVARIERCLIFNNVAGNSGGGMNLKKNTVAKHCQIYGNTANDPGIGGGGVYIYRAGNTLGQTDGGILQNCLVYNNYALYRGGGIYVHEGGLVKSCTVVSNACGYLNAGILISASSTYGQSYVVNTIAYSNMGAPTLRQDINALGDAVEVSNCCAAYLPEIAVNSITAYPLFLNPDPENPDYRLSPLSPCVNTGLYEEGMENEVDLDGLSRLDRFMRKVDMGAYESLPHGILMIVK